MGNILTCSCNNNDEIIEQALRRRIRNMKVDELDYTDDEVESGILTDEEEEEINKLTYSNIKDAKYKDETNTYKE